MTSKWRRRLHGGPSAGNKIVETKYDVCASRIFSSVSSNIELWVVFLLTFDYRKLSFWLSNTPTSEKTEKWISLSLSVWSNVLQGWNGRAGADRLALCSLCEWYISQRCWQDDSCHRCHLWTLRVWTAVQIAFVVLMAQRRMVYFIFSPTDRQHITLVSFSRHRMNNRKKKGWLQDPRLLTYYFLITCHLDQQWRSCSSCSTDKALFD